MVFLLIPATICTQTEDFYSYCFKADFEYLFPALQIGWEELAYPEKEEKAWCLYCLVYWNVSIASGNRVINSPVFLSVDPWKWFAGSKRKVEKN